MASVRRTFGSGASRSPAPPLEDGEELVAGRRPVEEAFAAGRPARRLLVTPQRRQALEKIVLHATTLRIPIVEVEGGSLTALSGSTAHQGVAVVVDARRFASWRTSSPGRSNVPSRPSRRARLARDPQNSAPCFGARGRRRARRVFPTERQAPLSPAAVKASAGATEHLLLAPVDDLPATLTDLHLRGVRIVGSEADAPLLAREADLRGAIALVVGSEGHGLSPAVRRRCDMFVRLPMRGAIDSLNAAVAGSIFLFEILGQRDASGASPSAQSASGVAAKPVKPKDAKPQETKPTAVKPREAKPKVGKPTRAKAPDAEPKAAADSANATKPKPTKPKAATAAKAPAKSAAAKATTAKESGAATKAAGTTRAATTPMRPQHRACPEAGGWLQCAAGGGG